MGFLVGNFPPVDPATFLDKPFRQRIREMATHWVDFGFGAPKVIPMIYVVKLLVLYVGVGTAVATLTSGLSWLDVTSWWNEPIVYQKLVIWTMLLEMLGIAGSWGPLAGHFQPMTGGFRYWLRPGTIRLAPWPDRVPLTSGDTRTVFDVALYLIATMCLAVTLMLPGVHSESIDSALADNAGLVRATLLIPFVVVLILLGLRDKVPFIAARSEQYLPAIVFFVGLPFVDMIIALKILIVSVWIGAGVSKFGRHFALVVPPMISNTPWLTLRSVKRAHYRAFPDDLRPSKLAGSVAHVLGTVVEVAAPLVLLFSTNRTLTLVAVVLMIAFHAFVASTFPLAVPLEWNILFAFATVFLFWGFPTWDGYGLGDMSSPWLVVVIVAALVFFPILGNLRPDLISFLPSMRQYAGNWASATWAFAPGAEEKLDTCIPRPAKITRTQLQRLYSPEEADVLIHLMLGWRAMHSQGRALYSLLLRHLGDDLDRYSVREAEFCCNSLVAFNFGDGHLHDEKLIAAIQRRCQFAPGEFVVAWIESQPIHRRVQEYKVIDAALGVIERGTFRVADAVAEQPWLPNGPIPFAVQWTLDGMREESR